MKSTTLKITMLAFLAIGTFSCKNNEKEVAKEIETAAEASEVAVEYKVDTAASAIKWEGSKPTTTHFGTIKLASGAFSVNNDKVEAGKFEIDMKSINVEDLEGEYKANLEAHLMGTVEGKEGDFFNANKYPTSKFELTKIEGNTVHGNLTIKEKTNAIEFPATITINGDNLELVSEPFNLDRTKWDVNFGSKSIFPNLGDKFVSDDMKITLSIVAKK
ncbi:YceI family protein [Aequorivita viscosa]|uniref:YceI-like domain-containing protein n=1 Tax=Aequorivita viscosa TaxID=797419 RepID=A0A1M6GAM9_9FLAO|nr:YceI family protein [Aequorivita viscosa]SDW86669.1 YceI-like domain-containing protein [Aequorivita viscosa]SHJ06974.1 YceI-like domain-containing protein [Aequorivita viscosa]